MGEWKKVPCALHAKRPVCTGLLLRKMKTKLSGRANWQKWLVGRVLRLNSNTETFHLFLHLLVIPGVQEAWFTLGLIEQRPLCRTELSALTRQGQQGLTRKGTHSHQDPAWDWASVQQS